jgi:hypothetical protein
MLHVFIKGAKAKEGEGEGANANEERGEGERGKERRRKRLNFKPQTPKKWLSGSNQYMHA